jgi:hypothetical protein
MPVYNTSWRFRDFQGRVAIERFYLDCASITVLGTGVAAIKTALEGISNAAITSFLDPPNEVVYGPDNQYFSAQDKAEFVFQDTKGAFHRLQVPCPQAIPAGNNIFLSDGVTVNPLNTTVVAYTGAILTYACSAAATGYSLFIGGIRIRRKLPRRTNILVQAPAGGSPEE